MKIEILKIPDSVNFGRAVGDVCEVQDSVGIDWVSHGWAKTVTTVEPVTAVDHGISTAGAGHGDGKDPKPSDAKTDAEKNEDAKDADSKKSDAKPVGAKDKAVHSKDHLR